MNVKVKSSNGITLIPMDSELMSARKIFIDDDISADTANEFLKKVTLLNYENDEKPIDIVINSNGGELNSGMMMYDVIQSSRAPIRTFCAGKAYSMAALLFAGGNHGRYMLPHSELMLHEPLLGNRVSGSSSSIKFISDALLKARKQMNRILSKHTHKTEQEIEEATGYDHYFDAEEAKSFGLCDGVVTFDEMINMED